MIASFRLISKFHFMGGAGQDTMVFVYRVYYNLTFERKWETSADRPAMIGHRADRALNGTQRHALGSINIFVIY